MNRRVAIHSSASLSSHVPKAPETMFYLLVSDHLDVAFEMLNVDGVETDDCWEKADICFREFFSEEIWAIGDFQDFFNAVEGFEEGEDVAFVCFLGGCKPGFIHAYIVLVCSNLYSNSCLRTRRRLTVIDLIIDPLIDLINLLFNFLLGPIVRCPLRFITVRQQAVKLSIQHPDNLTALIVHDRVLLLIPQHRHREPRIISLLCLVVHIFEEMRSGNRFWRNNDMGIEVIVVLLIRVGESPAVATEVPVHGGIGDVREEVFEVEGNESAVCPGTGVGDKEMVAVGFWWVRGVWRDGGAEG